jgi:enoyl-CoA hydratase
VSGPVRSERVGAAWLVTIDRPEARNAIDGATAAALLAAFEAFRDDDGARVMVLTGAGDKAFCAGADLKAIATLNPDLPGGPLGFTRLFSPKPAIAAVSGWAVAGGFELALWCDLRIVTEDARFAFLERRFGVPLIDGGTQRLPRVVGMGRALELVLTGRVVEAPEALAIGLANEIVGAGRHVERALEIAQLLATLPQETMLSDRRALHEGMALGLEREAELGRASVAVGARGAARFAAGEGRNSAPLTGMDSP